MQKRMKIPKDWTFQSDDVARHFNTHIKEQLPWYDMLTKAVGLIARHYIQHAGVVYDLGCSTGNISRELAEVMQHRQAKLLAIDNSPAMKEFFSGSGEFVLADVESYDYKPFDLAILYLILQFVSMEHRKPLLERLTAQCKPGGAIIIVDKYLSETDSAYIQTIKRRITLLGKTISGTSPSEIIEKELSLSGVQRPLDTSELFSGLGVKAYEFFRFGEFAGWILPK